MARLLLLLLFCVSACGGSAEGPEPLRVHAAASLRELLDDLSTEFEARHGVRVRLSTGGSNLITNQVLAGAPADVLVSASCLELERLVAAGVVRDVDVQQLFGNALVVVAPRGSQPPAADTSVAELLRGARRLSIAHPEAVPAGRYARAWLADLGLWDELEPHTLAGMDVRAALAAVASGGADLGIVYRTDAMASDGVRVVFEVPEAAPITEAPGAPGTRVRYVGGVLAGSSRPELARAFLDLCAGRQPASRGLIEARGFRPLAE